MKSESIDWPVIRKSLIGLISCLVVCSLFVGVTIYFRDDMERDKRRHDSQFQNISRKYLAIDEEEKLVQEYYPIFLDLYHKGVIGEERRLDWIEVLRMAEEEIKIPSLSYSIESQKVYTPSFSVNLKRYRLYRSVMKLNMQLLHEGDLFNLLRILDQNTQGNYNVAECELVNNTVIKLVEDPSAGNVHAECKLEWFTIKLADGKKLKV